MMTDCIPTTTSLPDEFKVGAELESDVADVTLYWRIIGKQLYLTTTQPDIVYATGILSQFIINPRKVHIDAARHILRYLNNTTYYGIFYRQEESSVITGWTNAD